MCSYMRAYTYIMIFMLQRILRRKIRSRPKTRNILYFIIIIIWQHSCQQCSISEMLWKLKAMAAGTIKRPYSTAHLHILPPTPFSLFPYTCTLYLQKTYLLLYTTCIPHTYKTQECILKSKRKCHQ